MRRVKNTILLDPTVDEIKTIAKQVGLRKFSPELIQDFAAVDAGGEIREYDEFEEDLRAEARPKITREGYKARDGAIYNSFQEAYEVNYKGLSVYNSNVINFMRDNKERLQEFPGSPLERACQLVKALSDVGGEQSGDPGDCENQLPIFNNVELMDKFNNIMDQVVNLDLHDRELMDEDIRKELGDKVQYMKVERIKKMSKSNLPEILDIGRKVEEFIPRPNLKKITPDRNGSYIRNRNIQDLSEFDKIKQTSLASYANPKLKKFFLYQAVTNQLQVKEKIIFNDKKQFIYILLDGSGSMSDREKINSAMGIIYNRMKAVRENDAIVWVSPFESSLGQETWIMDKKETAYDIYKKIQECSFSGGGTDTGRSIEEALVRMNKMLLEDPTLTQPEIVVITDDDASASNIHPDKYKGVVIHGFAVSSSNNYLRDLCHKTGGKFKQYF